MATIIEILDYEFEHLSEYTEKILKYGGKLMQCLEEICPEHKYTERSIHMDRHKDIERHDRKRRHYEDDDEFIRYY